MVDIGNLAGVAQATVSRVFRMPDLVAPETRDRVRLAADRLGYVPNLVAGSLAAKRTNLIVVIVPIIEHSNFSAMLHGISDTVLASGFETAIALSGSSETREEQLVASFLGWRPAAIVLTGTQHSSGTRNLLRRANVPVVEAWNLTSDPIDMNVGFSNRHAARAITEKLIASGRRFIGMICGPTDVNDRARDRQAGYMSAIKAHRLRADLVEEVSDPAGVHLVAELIDRLIGRERRLDALFCSGDSYAMAAVFACQRLGWPVPQRIAVAGIGDAAMASLMRPALTTAQVPGYEIGVKAGEMLITRLAGRRIKARSVDMGFRIVVRESAD